MLHAHGVNEFKLDAEIFIALVHKISRRLVKESLRFQQRLTNCFFACDETLEAHQLE